MTEEPRQLEEWRRTVDDGDVFLYLHDAGRVLIGAESDLAAMTQEISAMVDELHYDQRWPNLFGYLFGGAPADEPMSRARARRIGLEAADMLPLTFGQLAARSKVVLGRLAGLSSI
jgi:hypothetical protein